MRLPDLKRVSHPQTVAEAVGILSDPDRKAIPFSGGVSFIFAPFPGKQEVVFLNRLPLNYIWAREGGLEIGATTPVADLVGSGAVRAYADGILWAAARRIGSTLNRNLITVGGNLVQPFIWSDLPTVALALGAKFRLQGKRQQRTVEAEQFLAQPPREILNQGELLTAICFPSLPPSSRSAYRKFALTENDFAILKVAITLTRRRRLCREITAVAGGGTLLPQRLAAAGNVIRGKTASQSLVNQASEEGGAEIKLSADIRCPEAYKREVCRALVRGILEEILLDQESGETWKLF